MNFIKRGFLGITRNVGKSFILLLVIFILGNLIAGAVSIWQATGKVEETIKEQLGTEASIALDYAEYLELSEMEQMNFWLEDISVDLIKQIGESPYVKYYDYFTSITLEPSSIKSYQFYDVAESDIGKAFTLKGVNHPLVLDFEEKNGELIEGRVFTQAEVDNGAAVTIISKKLAELNGLHVGDSIIMKNTFYDIYAGFREELEIVSRDLVLEVIGLYEPPMIRQGKESEQEMRNTDVYFQNMMYVPNKIAIEELMFLQEAYAAYYAELEPEYEASEDTISHQSLYFLKNPDDAEAFMLEMKSILPPFYKISTALEQYDSIAGSIGAMAELSKIVLVMAVLATVIIISLVLVLFIRDRKHELGIYLSLGEHRRRVVGQILIEVMVIAFIGITMAVFSGNILASQVSDVLMEMNYDNSDLPEDFYMYGGQVQIDVMEEDVLEAYEIELTGGYILGFYMIGLLTVLISTTIPLIYVVRLNPKKILM